MEIKQKALSKFAFTFFKRNVIHKKKKKKIEISVFFFFSILDFNLQPLSNEWINLWKMQNKDNFF